MTKKINSIIEMLLNMHNRVIKKYRNLEMIEGQYKPKVQLIAKILQEQTQRKIDVCQDILANKMSFQLDITDEGYDEVLDITRACEKATTISMNSNEDDVLSAAAEFSRNKIELFTSMIEMFVRYEKDKNIKHEDLKDKLLMILTLEKKDHSTLLSFKK